MSASGDDLLVIRHLRGLRDDMAKGFAGVRAEVARGLGDVDERLVKIEGTLKDLTLGLKIAARLTKLEVDVAKLKRAGGHK